MHSDNLHWKYREVELAVKVKLFLSYALKQSMSDSMMSTLCSCHDRVNVIYSPGLIIKKGQTYNKHYKVVVDFPRDVRTITEM